LVWQSAWAARSNVFEAARAHEMDPSALPIFIAWWADETEVSKSSK
jgi:hypothetical protein